MVHQKNGFFCNVSELQLSISEMNKSSKFREHFDFFYMHSEV